MLQSLEEVRKVEMAPGGVINGVDNPNLMSVDSITPIVTEADVISAEEETKEEKKEDKKEETKIKTEASAAQVENKAEVKVEEKKEKAKKEEAKKEEAKYDPLADNVKDPFEKRIGKVTKKWRVAERERDYERSKRAEAEAELAKLRAQIPLTGKPKKEDFESDEEFVDALTDWKVENKFKSMQPVGATVSEDSAFQQEVSELEQRLDEVAESGSSKYKDYKELVFAKDLAMTRDMVDVIVQSEVAEDLFYFLAKNPDISAGISEMPVVKAARELGKLEGKLIGEASKSTSLEKAEVKEVVKPIVKKLTNTPEPINPVRATGVVDKDPNQMNAREYRAWRESQKR